MAERDYAVPAVEEAGDIRDLTGGNDNKFSDTGSGMGPQKMTDERIDDTPVDLPARDAH